MYFLLYKNKELKTKQKYTTVTSCAIVIQFSLPVEKSRNSDLSRMPQPFIAATPAVILAISVVFSKAV